MYMYNSRLSLEKHQFILVSAIRLRKSSSLSTPVKLPPVRFKFFLSTAAKSLTTKNNNQKKKRKANKHVN